MKLPLIALVIEICLARIFTGSWGWAVVIVMLYCAFVYVRLTMLVKKQNKDKSSMEFEYPMVQDDMNGSTKSRKELYNVYPTIDAGQNN